MLGPEDHKTIKERILSLHVDKEEIETDIAMLLFQKRSYELMYERISKNPKAKQAILDEIEDNIIEIEESLAIAGDKIYSYEESFISICDTH